MSKFKVGQKVVCIKGGKGAPGLYTNPTIKGKIYTIKRIIKKSCCGGNALDVGFTPIGTVMSCPCGNSYSANDILWCNEFRFAPIEEDGSSIKLSKEFIEELKLEEIEYN